MDATTALIQELNGLKEIIGDIASRKIFFINSLHNSHLSLCAPISVSLEYEVVTIYYFGFAKKANVMSNE